MLFGVIRYRNMRADAGEDNKPQHAQTQEELFRSKTE